MAVEFFLPLVLTSLALLWWQAIAALAVDPQPNIIFILADDLGWNDVGFHGSTQVITPNIDRLSHEGIILDNYYTQAVCTPSRSALLTSRYPAMIGMQHFVISCTEPWGLDPAQKILPQYLQGANYATHMVGKWHQGYFLKKYTPTYRGFDTYYGHYFNTDYWTHSGYSDETDSYGLDFHENEGTRLDISNINDTVGQYLTDLYTQRAVQLIQNHPNNPSKPFFLYLANWATHGANAGDPLQSTADRLALFSSVNHTQRAKFLGMLKALDDGVGAVMKAVNDRGWTNNTIIAFASDNGGPEAGFMHNYATNWPLRGGKNTMWEGGVRVPAFIWSKQLQNTGYRSQHLMHVTDWLPTLVNRAAAGPLGTVDGFDMWPALSSGSGSASPRNEILLQYDQIYGWGAIRVGDWKLMLNESVQSYRNTPYQHLPEGDPNPTTTVTCGPPPPSNDTKYTCSGTSSTCLFNIASDPCESTNLATDRPEIVQQLLQRFSEYQQKTVWPRNRPYDPCANSALYGGKWLNWLDYTGGEAYESQLPTFKSAAELLAYENADIIGVPCKRTVTSPVPTNSGWLRQYGASYWILLGIGLLGQSLLRVHRSSTDMMCQS